MENVADSSPTYKNKVMQSKRMKGMSANEDDEG
jgi:hypothetical protein